MYARLIPQLWGGTQRPLRLSPARASELHQRLAALVNEFVTYAGESEVDVQDYLLTTMLFPITVDDPVEDVEAETGE